MPSRSRGNRKYNNGGVNAQQGVIVENNWQNQSPILYTVLDFVKHQSFYVLRSAYKSFPFNDGRHDGDEAKLKIFENVNYEADGRNLVREKVIRTEHWKKKVICVDMGNGIFAVKAICAFSPDYPTKCYTNIAGEVECSKESYSKVLCSNVAFDCWICFSFVPSSEVDVMKPSVNRITYKLHSVEHVNPTFDFIFSASWNKGLPRKMYDIYDPFTNSVPAQNIRKITGLRAYYLSCKSIYIPGKPRMPVLLASNQFTSDLRNYVPLLVNVFFSEVLNRWIPYEMKARDGNDLQATLTDDNYHETNLSPIFKCPGFFIFGKNGLVHDKFGQLREYYHRDFGTGNVFCYVDPDEHSYTPLEIPRSKKILLSDLKGIIYDGIYIGNNEFYSPHLHYCLIQVPDEADYKIGFWYKLNVESFDDENLVVTVSAVLTPDYGHIPSKKIGNIHEFLVEVTVERCAIFAFVVAEFLGAIGIKESECEKCFGGAVGACAIQFPPSRELPEHRPQVRPFVIRDYKDFQQGMQMGSYQ